MYKVLRTVFTSAAILRVLNVLAYFIILQILDADKPKSYWIDLDLDIKIDFPWWTYLMMYTLIIAFPVNTVIWLLFSFKPEWTVSRFLKSKSRAVIFFTLEVALLFIFSYILYVRLEDIFYEPEPSTYLGSLVEMFGGNERVITAEEKLTATCFGIATLTSLIIVLHFWWLYNRVKASFQADLRRY